MHEFHPDLSNNTVDNMKRKDTGKLRVREQWKKKDFSIS